MESIKQENLENLSEENGHPSLLHKSKDDHNSSGTRRSYECTFCKRGFTNAQALGGHMNIHRKEKEKVKAEKILTKSKKKDHMINNAPSSYFTKISSDDHLGKYEHSSFELQMNYQSYLPPSNNPVAKYPQGYNCHYASGYYGAQRVDKFGVYDEDHLGSNLSIGIGTTDMGSSSRRGKSRDGKEDWCDNEVDLELRLGYYP